MGVAPELAQCGAQLPQPLDGVGVIAQRAVRGEQRPRDDGRVLDDRQQRARQLGGRLVQSGVNPAQGAGGAAGAFLQDMGGADELPGRGQRAGHHAGREDAEHGGGERGFHGTERCRTGGEVAHPEAFEAQGLAQATTLLVEVGDGVQRFGQQPKRSGAQLHARTLPL